jgi:hypothetical protein
MDKILTKVLEISDESYRQERERSNNLLTKSDYIIKYISTAFVFTNAIFALLASNKVIKIGILAVLYILIAVTFCISLYYAVRAQVLRKAKYYPTGNTIIKELESDFEKKPVMPTDITMLNKLINYSSDYIEELQKVNDDRAKLINIAYKSYLVSISLISLSFIAIMIIIA